MTARRLGWALLLAAAVDPLSAGALDDALRATWVGEWVVVRTEVYADCMGCITLNEVEPGGVRSAGVRRFEPGELGRVVEAEVKRERVEVVVELAEPLLVSLPRAGFLLYQERGCALRLRIPVGRQSVAARDTAALDEGLGAVLERVATPAEGQASALWNGRMRRSAPDDYQATLEAYRAWRAGWVERATAAAAEVAREVIWRHPTVSYLDGFAEGTAAFDPDLSTSPGGVAISYQDRRNWSFTVDEAVDRPSWGGCEELADLPLPEVPASAEGVGADDSEERWRGRSDGYALTYALELIARLKECERAAGGEPEP